MLELQLESDVKIQPSPAQPSSPLLQLENFVRFGGAFASLVHQVARALQAHAELMHNVASHRARITTVRTAKHDPSE
jgi:hypothetical protein